METLTNDAPRRLVYKVRSRARHVAGAAAAVCFGWLAWHLLASRADTPRATGLLGAGAICLLVVLVSESSDFVFDAGAGSLSWTRQLGFVRRAGDVPLSQVEQVVVRTALGSSRFYPRRRICLLTRDGELPLTTYYSSGAEHLRHAERLREFLGLTASDPLEASVRSLVTAGRDGDAVRELRAARGISLAEARAEVALVRARAGEKEAS